MKEDSLLVALTSAHKVVALTRPHDNFRFVSKTFNNFVKGGGYMLLHRYYYRNIITMWGLSKFSPMWAWRW